MPVTVTSAAESTDLTTLAVVKDELGISGSDHDAKLERYIDRASQTIVSYCNRNFAQQRVTETMTSTGGTLLKTSEAPIVTLHSVTYSGAVVETSKYYGDTLAAGLIRNKTSWFNTSGELDYSLDYVYGYVLPSFSLGTVDLPADIQQACIDLVKAFFLSRERDPSIQKEGIPSVYFATYGKDSGGFGGATGMLPSQVEAILRPYKRYQV